MNFRSYQWFKNPRGLHNDGAYAPLYLDRYLSAHMGWAKLVSGTNEHLDAAKQLLAHGCMPIIRIYEERIGNAPPPEETYGYIQEYVAAGCRWFEFYNEPNMDIEWPVVERNGKAVNYIDWQNRDGIIGPLMDNWLVWAERVIAMGAYPAFPAMTETTDSRLATTLWLEACISYLHVKNPDRFVEVLNHGLWAATHPYLLNHFYQAIASGPQDLPRTYLQENADEKGWHFEYPYDPLQQRIDPGRTVFGGTKLTPYGDPNGLLAGGEIVQQLLKRYFDMGPVPVIGTEGGIIDVPAPGDPPIQQDVRYPPYSHASAAEATSALWSWVAKDAPPWFFGLTLWLEKDYYRQDGTPNLLMQRMIDEPQASRIVPDVDTASGNVYDLGQLGTPASEVKSTPRPAPGPGPISGSPDYHWLVLAPGLQADWFFQAAQRYWQTFRPTVLTDWSLIRTVPYSKTLAVTVLARSDTIKYMDKKVRDVWPNVYYDAIVYDTLAEMQVELDRRATILKRFG